MKIGCAAGEDAASCVLVAPGVLRRQSSSKDRRLRKLFNGERGLPVAPTEKLLFGQCKANPVAHSPAHVASPAQNRSILSNPFSIFAMLVA